MGAWKDWQIGMIEDGHTAAEITDAERRIKGTLADPLVKRLVAERLERELADLRASVARPSAHVADGIGWTPR